VAAVRVLKPSSNSQDVERQDSATRLSPGFLDGTLAAIAAWDAKQGLARSQPSTAEEPAPAAAPEVALPGQRTGQSISFGTAETAESGAVESTECCGPARQIDRRTGAG